MPNHSQELQGLIFISSLLTLVTTSLSVGNLAVERYLLRKGTCSCICALTQEKNLTNAGIARRASPQLAIAKIMSVDITTTSKNILLMILDPMHVVYVL